MYLMLGGIGGRRRKRRGWDGWMASLTRWTWVWVKSGSWWWTGRPGVLWFMGLQRVGHNWATELNWTDVPLTSFTQYTHPPITVSGNLQFIFCTYENLFFFFFFLNSIYKWDHILFVFLFIWFSIMFSRSILLVANSKILFFLWLNTIPLCVCIHTSHFLHPFLH